MKALAFAILGFSLVAQAHAGPPKPLDITEQRNEAVGFAITQAVAVNDMRLACEGIPDAGTRFSDVERRWLKRNGSYLDAARGWMAYVKVAIAEQEGSVAADAFSSRTNQRFADQASKIAADAMSGFTVDAEHCNRWASLVDAGQGDLEQNAKYAHDLQDIRAFHESVEAWRDHSISGNPEDLTACVEGWSLTEAGNYAGAIRSYDACINDGHLSSVSLARTYRNIGITYRRAKKPIKAVKAYDKAIALHPHDIVDDYIDRANAYDEADEFDNAMADYAQALKMDPGFGEIYYNRGVAYEHHHMMDKAKADFIAAYDHGLRTPLLHEKLAVYGVVPEEK